MKTRAALFHAPGETLEVREIDVEEPGPDDVLVRIAATGVCGSDLHVVRGEWKRPVPMVLGHEGAGVVEAVGSRVTGVAPGERVVLSWAPSCGECGPCLAGRPVACAPLRAGIAAGTLADGTTRLSLGGKPVYRMTSIGSWAERMLLPAKAVLPIPDDLPLEEAALIGCAALTGVGAVLNRARVEPGAVAGEFDYAFDAVGGRETFDLAVRSTRGGGTVVAVGMAAAGVRYELDPFQLTNEEKWLTGSLYGSEDPAVALPRMLQLVRDDQLDLEGTLGPTFSLDEVNEAIAASLGGSPGRVLVVP